MSRACESFCSIHHPTNIKNIIERLSRNKDIIIMKQDKRSGVFIINKRRYHEKFLELLNTDEFTKLNLDPTKKSQV